MKITPATFLEAKVATSTILDTQSLEKYIRLKGERDTTEIIHLHCCRSGPALANEIFLSLKEKHNWPKLQKIFGVVQPGGVLAKYVLYWYGGLDQEYVVDFFKNIKFQNKVTKNGDNQKQWFDFLMSDVDALTINAKHGIKIMLEPLLDSEAKCFLKTINLTKAELLKKVHSLFLKERVLTFRKFLERLSLFLVNLLLVNKSLPIICFLDVSEFENTHKLNFKYIDTSRGVKRLVLQKLRQARSKESAIFELKKRLRGYVDCSYSQFIELFNDLSKKPNSALSLGVLGVNEAISVCLRGDFVDKNSRIDVYQDLINANKIIPSLIGEKGTARYVTGVDMIDICFKVAKTKEAPVILQKFFREGGYKKYEEMMKSYEDVDTYKSSVDIWNTDVFADYDTNLFKGAKYVLEN